MIELSCEKILEACNLEYICGDKARMCKGCTIDSRQVTQDSIFVAFKGERVDGNAYVENAIASGAALCIMSERPQADLIAKAELEGCVLAYIQDEDGEECMLALAGAWRDANPQWKVVGITGSVGKTTTKQICAAAASAQVKTCATKGNFNNLIGMPLTLMQASRDDEVVILEMGMNHAGELTRLTCCARPDVAIITNIGTSHIGNLGGRDNICRAKAEILKGMTPSSVKTSSGVTSKLVVFAQDSYAQVLENEYAKPLGIQVVKAGITDIDDAYLSDLALDDKVCPGFIMHYEDGQAYPVQLSIPGKASAYDCVLALCALDALGLDKNLACKGAGQVENTGMRMEILGDANTPCIINDTYNASTPSMAQALDVLACWDSQGKRIAVLGEMGEMGQEAPGMHRLVGAYAAGKGLDMLCVIGHELADCMAEGARLVGMSEDKIEVFRDVPEALTILKPIFTKDDVILVKASRSCELEKFSKGVLL